MSENKKNEFEYNLDVFVSTKNFAGLKLVNNISHDDQFLGYFYF